MKDKLKNTLEHEVELLGRSISVLAIAGLLVVGGASAALLNSFGTVSGEATVDQSVTFEGQTDNSGITADYDTESGEAIVAGQVFAQSETLTNDAENPVTVTIDSTTETVSNGDGNTDGVDNTVFDVSETKNVTTDAGELEIGYEEADDEVTFTPTEVSTYHDIEDGEYAGVVFGFDTDNDGTYDFQFDSVSSNVQGDLYEWTDNSEDKSDHVEHHNYNGETNDDWNTETNGVYFTNPDTELSNKDSFTLTVDAERLGSSFSVNAEQDGSSFLSNLNANDATETNPGEDVTNSEVTLQGDSSRDLAIITEFAINLDPSYDYSVTTDVVPTGQDVGGESADTPTN